MFDFKNILQQAQSIQAQFAELQKQFTQDRVCGEGGAGLVKVEFGGDRKVKKIAIDDSIAHDKEIIAELLVAAINDCMTQLEEKKRAYYQKMAEKYNIPTEIFPF